MRNLAHDVDYPTTIVASIHQPSSRLYQSFDTVLVLAQGKQVYFGPGGHAPAEYFEQRGLACPPDYNVADHLLEIASSPPGVIQRLMDGISTRGQEDLPIKGTAIRSHETPGILEKGGMAFDGTVPTLNGTPTSVSNGSGSDSSAYEDREGNIIVPVASKIKTSGGAGKSTFVDILAGRRKTGGKVVGQVDFFGQETNETGGKGTTHRVGFVDQVGRFPHHCSALCRRADKVYSSASTGRRSESDLYRP